MNLIEKEILTPDERRDILGKGMEERTIEDIVGLTLAAANLAMDLAKVPYSLRHRVDPETKSISLTLYKK